MPTRTDTITLLEVGNEFAFCPTHKHCVLFNRISVTICTVLILFSEVLEVELLSTLDLTS